MNEREIMDLVNKAKRGRVNIVLFQILYGIDAFNEHFHANCKDISDVHAFADEWYVSYIKRNLR